MSTLISPSRQLKSRDSNMELLRIVSMLLVLLVHADYLSLGAPTTEDVATHPTESFMKMLVYSISTVCVNCFVLLSGWYGIRPKLKRLGEFLFQVIFICGTSLSIYLLCSQCWPGCTRSKRSGSPVILQAPVLHPMQPELHSPVASRYSSVPVSAHAFLPESITSPVSVT